MARRKPNKMEEGNFQDEFAKAELAKGERKEKAKVDDSFNTKPRNARGGKYSITTHRTAANPIEMHSISDEYLEPLGKLAEFITSGKPIWQQYAPGALNSSDSIAQNIGGIMRIGYVPSIGNASNPQSGVNKASVDEFNIIRSATGGTNYYEAPDIALYNIAVSSLYSLYAIGTRLYAVIRPWEVDNQYLPQAIVYSMGFDYNDFKANIVKFRGWLNLFADQISSRLMPTGIAYFDRQIWMTSNIYKDADTEQCQMYLFMPTALYQLQEGISAHSLQYYLKKQVKAPAVGQTYLKLVSAPWTTDGVHFPNVQQPYIGQATGFCTVDQFIEFANSIWNPILASQDFAFISSGIRRAFKSFVNVQPIDEDYTLTPVYDESVLMQIENSATLEGVVNISSVISENVTINQGYIEQDLAVLRNPLPYSGGYMPQLAPQLYAAMDAKTTYLDSILLNFHEQTEINSANVMEASRMISQYDPSNTTAVNENTIKAAVNAQRVPSPIIAGVSNAWARIATHASEVYIDRMLISLTPLSAGQPWKGAMLTQWPCPTYIRVPYTGNAWLSLLNATGADQAKVMQAVISETNVRESIDRMLTLLAQWDWHPRVIYDLLYAMDASGASASVTRVGQMIDFNRIAILDFEQLAELNDYDILSQFVVR